MCIEVKSDGLTFYIKIDVCIHICGEYVSTWMIDIDVYDMYVWICVCARNLHKLYLCDISIIWLVIWKSISQCNWHCVCYLDGWYVCDVVYAYLVYFYACMKEKAVREPVGFEDGGRWFDRVIGGVIGRIIDGVIDGE